MAHRQGEQRPPLLHPPCANTVFAFFEFPDAGQPEWLEATKPKSTGTSITSTFTSASIDDIRYWRKRLEEHGIPMTRTISGDSIFFHDPNNIVINSHNVEGNEPADHRRPGSNLLREWGLGIRD
ncbi:MAG: hypothetical protein R2849_14450 [Thermomicrobiales bacterium]